MSYGEPWRTGYASSDKLPVPVVSSTSNLNVGIISKIADADRIIACVNALEGVPTEELHAVNLFSANCDGSPVMRFHRLNVALHALMTMELEKNEDGREGAEYDRIDACVNACAGIPTEDVVETIELWKEFYFR